MGWGPPGARQVPPRTAADAPQEESRWAAGAPQEESRCTPVWRQLHPVWRQVHPRRKAGAPQYGGSCTQYGGRCVAVFCFNCIRHCGFQGGLPHPPVHFSEQNVSSGVVFRVAFCILLKKFQKNFVSSEAFLGLRSVSFFFLRSKRAQIFFS